jgi:uncharacterized protein YjdB
VSVWVGGAPAEVVSANGNSVLFRVPNAAPLGATTVEAANPGGKRTSIAFTVLGGPSGITVQPVPDTGSASTASIGRDGGTISTGGLTLTIPAGALSETEQITVTPLLGLNGSPLQGLVVGAVFAPDGLALLAPAILSFPAPAGTTAAEILAFGFTGNGLDFHLVPHEFEGGVVELEVWHFSGAGGHFGGSPGGATWIPGTAETQALQELALAANACAQSGDAASQACTVELPDRGRAALLRWYVDAVEPALDAALGAPSFEVEAAFQEWLRWGAQVDRLATNFPLLTLQDRRNEAAIRATEALADLTSRRLNNCTGTDLLSQLRDVIRMSDLAAAGAIDLTTEGLPSAFNAGLMRACASVKIDPPTFPDVAARVDANQLGVRTYIGTYTGAQIMTEPLELTLTLTNADSDASHGVPDSNGDFQTNIYPLAAVTGVVIDIAVALGANALPQLTDAVQRDSLGSVERVIRSARDRIELEPLTGVSTTVSAGASAPLKVRVAGNGMANATVGYSVNGPGSVSSTSGVTNQDGEAPTFNYIAPANPSGTTATVTATLGSDQDSVTFTLSIVQVSVSPTSVSLSTGQTRQFTATVTGTPNTAVVWSATGGTIDPVTGVFSASSPGTYTIRATSVLGSGFFGEATAVVSSVSGQLTLLSRESRVLASAGGCAGQQGSGCVEQGDSEDVSTLPSDFGEFDRDLGTKSFAQTGTGIYAGNFASATASASQVSRLVPGASSLFVDAFVGSAAGTSNLVLGPIQSASAGYAAWSTLLVRFRVVGSGLPYEAGGSLVANPQQLGSAVFGLYRADAPYTLIEHFDKTDFDVSGTLPPGIYEVSVSVSCGYGGAVAATSACETGFSAYLKVGP